MDIHTYFRSLSALISHPGYFLRKKKYIFVLSHMRAYTTLISHILASNNKINGYTEQHIPYYGGTDLIRLRYKLFNIYKKTKTLDAEYLLDKLLHNNLTISENILQCKDISFIVLTRKPSETVPSIIQMANRLNLGNLKELEHTINYYDKRLTYIEKISEKLNNRFFYIEGDELMDNTDKVLIELTNFLGLDTPLSKEYETFSLTGKTGIGDSSKYISSGKILKQRHSGKRPSRVLLDMDSDYEKTIANIRKHAIKYTT